MLDLTRIGYIFEAPNYNGKYLGKPDRMRKQLAFWARMETLLNKDRWEPDPEANEELMLASIHADIRRRIKRGKPPLVNPLIVKRGEPGRYYAIRGNQRLCALRASGYELPVPCRVALPGDTWRPTTAAFLAHPYEDVALCKPN